MCHYYSVSISQLGERGSLPSAISATTLFPISFLSSDPRNVSRRNSLAVKAPRSKIYHPFLFPIAVPLTAETFLSFPLFLTQFSTLFIALPSSNGHSIDRCAVGAHIFRSAGDQAQPSFSQIRLDH